MFYIFIFLFIVFPLAEIAVLIKIGSYLGLASTILIIIGTAVLGATLARIQGLKVLVEIQHDLNAGKMPADKLIDGLLILLAGVVLLTPGFITDAMGFFVLWPGGRRIVKKLLMRGFQKRMQQHEVNMRYFRQDDIS